MVERPIPARPAYIYAIINRVTGHIYVGKAVTIVKRWHDHRKMARRGKHTHFYNAIRLYGVKQFELFELEHVSSEEEAYVSERWWIQYLKSIGAVLYNQNEGGLGATQPSVETRRRNSDAHKGRCYMSAEGRKKIAEANARRVISEETRRKLSKANRLHKSNSRLIEFNGQVLSMAEWAETLGMNYDTLQARLDRGWPIHLALTPTATRSDKMAWMGTLKLERAYATIAQRERRRRRRLEQGLP